MYSTPRSRAATLALFCFVPAASCGDDPTPPATASSVAVQPASPQMLLGDSVLLTAAISDARGRPLTDRTVAWSSQDPSVVRVDGRGMMFAEAVGSTVITATVEGVSGTAQVRVDPTPVATIDLGAESIALTVGASEQLAAHLRDAHARDLSPYYDVTWSSSDVDVASVVASGTVTGVATGTAMISASAGGVTATIEARVDGAPIGADGGTLTSADGRARLDIPANALTTPTVITIRPATGIPASARLAEGSAYTLEPSGLAFAEPVRLTIDFGDAAGIAGSAERYLALHRWTDGEWVPAADEAADTVAGTVTGTLTSFSSYGAVLSDLMESLVELQATLDRVLGDPIVHDALTLIGIVAGFAQASDNPLFNALVVPALEAARVTACNAYSNAIAQANAQTIDSYAKFTTQAERVVLWRGIVESLPDPETCATPVSFDFVLEKLITEFADFTIQRLEAGQLETDYPKLLEEAGLIVTLRGHAAGLGVPDVDLRLFQDAQIPLVIRLRTSAYAECRERREHHYLGQLLATSQLLDDAGYGADDLLRDLQLCGTNVAFTVQDEDDGTVASGVLGGGPQPGTGTTEASAPGLATGTLRLSDTLLAFRCASGTFEQDVVTVLLDGTEVHTLPFNTGGNFLMQPVELDFEPMLQAAGIDPDESATRTLSITRSSSGCGTYVDDASPFTLASLGLTYPAPFVYTEDFEEGAPGPAWSSQSIETSPSGERFLGRFAVFTLQLTLTDLPAHDSVHIEFDLHIIGSWDGNDGDFIRFQSGTLDFMTTFANDPTSMQSYPSAYPASHARGTGSIATDQLGYALDTESFQNTTYRIAYTLPHMADTFTFTITGTPQSSSNREHWGIDNVVVRTR